MGHANFFFLSLNKMGKLGHVNGPQLSTKDLVQALTIILRKSASGASQGSIDHRIEQAMDLVKSHLMAAVRTEVDELRDKISKLEDTVSFLSRENEFLRAHVSPEVLSNLPGPRVFQAESAQTQRVRASDHCRHKTTRVRVTVRSLASYDKSLHCNCRRVICFEW